VYLNERFGKGIRSSGYGTAYTVSLILPSMYSVWIGVLQHVMPYDYAPLVLIVLGGVLFAAGAWIGPETVTGGALTEEAGQAAATRAGASLAAPSPVSGRTVTGGDAS
jgi:hypothetical protein